MHLVSKYCERLLYVIGAGDFQPLLRIVARSGTCQGPDFLGLSRVYYDPRALELEGPAGVLHAKVVVIDDEAVFVTSANLTEAALDRNIEVGLLVRDRALAASMSSHFQVLIDRGLLRPLLMA